jgi:hypothetical protein
LLRIRSDEKRQAEREQKPDDTLNMVEVFVEGCRVGHGIILRESWCKCQGGSVSQIFILKGWQMFER